MQAVHDANDDSTEANPTRPLEIVGAAVSGLCVGLLTLNLSWASGCVPPLKGCGSHSAFSTLGWETAVPVGVGVLSVIAATWALLRPGSLRASSWTLSALFACGVVMLAFCIRALGHPFTSEFAGQQPAGWNYGVGLKLFAGSAVIPFIAFGLGLRRASVLSARAVPRWWRFVSGSRSTRWFA